MWWKKWMSAAAAKAAAALDCILPPRARTARVRMHVQAGLPLAVFTHSAGTVHITTLLDYRTKEVADVIHSLKYDGNAQAARVLADTLADFLREELATLRAFSPRPIILVPVPLHSKRKRERGFNQVERILAALPHEFQDGEMACIVPRALVRVRATPPQTKLPRHERLKNLKDAFAAEAKIVRGTHAIVIDDVSTTGATLSACAQTLAKAGAKVSAIALAQA